MNEDLSLVEKVKRLVRGRQFAYAQVFDPENRFTKEVMEDLIQFCRFGESSFHADARVHALIEGRREVITRIIHHLKLDPEEFWEKYRKKG